MFRKTSFAILAGVLLIAFNPLLSSVPAEARHFGGGHFGGGHFGGHHFGGGHFGHFGGHHFGGRHFGHFGGRHFGHHFAGRHHFGGHHFAGRHHFRGHHFAGRHNHGHRFAQGHSGGRFAGHRHFASHGRALASTGRLTRNFGRHGYGHGFARNAFWHNHYAGGRWRGYRNYGWYGPVFWPYAYGDAFAFALWPYDYYDPFWDYGPDWIVSSIFWPLGEPSAYYGYGYGGDYGYADGDIYGVGTARRTTSTASAQIPQRQEDACGSLAPGLSKFPEAKIEKAIAPATDEQKAALKDVNAAMAQGTDVMRQACPAEAPLTPPAKLDAVIQRLTAMKTAINDIREPLDKLYGLLNDSQKHRFDRAILASRPARKSNPQQPSNFDIAKLCGTHGPAFADLPATEIERVVSLDDSQRGKLEALKTASKKAEEISKSGCISSMPATVGGRLDATEKRVDALIQAANELKPAVGEFYASLSDEQKARFNSMGQATAQSAPNSAPASSTGSSTGTSGSQSTPSSEKKGEH